MPDEVTLVVVAATAAALVSALAVMGQAIAQRGQHRLEEAQAHLQQGDAWNRLRPDWQRCLIAGLGPSMSVHWGISRHEVEEYRTLLERHREAEVAWLQLLEGDPSESAVDIEKLIEKSQQELEPLEVYRQSVQRVLTYLAQLSGLVLRKRIAVSVAYDAIGHDVLRLGMHIRPLISVSYGMSGCAAPANMERMYWKSAELDIVSARLGWGDFLAASRGTAERILLLHQLLVAHAYRNGDADDDIGFHEAQIPMSDELCLPNRLALCWKAARRYGRRRAISLVLKIARAGRLSRRKRPYEYMPRTARLVGKHLPDWPFGRDSAAWFRLQRYILTSVAAVFDVARAPVDVLRAWRLSRHILDVRRLDDPPEVQSLRNQEALAEEKLRSFWSSHYDVFSDRYAVEG